MSAINFENLRPVEEAAKAVGMSRVRVRRLAITNGLAVRWGGSDKHPRIKVDLPGLKRCIAEQIEVRPPSPVVKQQQRQPAGRSRRRHPQTGAPLHPHVKC